MSGKGTKDDPWVLKTPQRAAQPDEGEVTFR